MTKILGGERDRAWSRNILVAAHFRYLQSTGFVPLKLDIVSFVVLVIFVNNGELEKLSVDGVPEAVTNVTKQWELPATWWECYLVLREQNVALTARLFDGMWIVWGTGSRAYAFRCGQARE